MECLLFNVISFSHGFPKDMRFENIFHEIYCLLRIVCCSGKLLTKYVTKVILLPFRISKQVYMVQITFNED